MAFVKNINCHEAVSLISDYLDGALTGRNQSPAGTPLGGVRCVQRVP